MSAPIVANAAAFIKDSMEKWSMTSHHAILSMQMADFGLPNKAFLRPHLSSNGLFGAIPTCGVYFLD